MAVQVGRVRRGGLSLSARRTLSAYTFLAVPLAFFLTIRIAPAAGALVISLHRWNVVGADQPFVGLANFREIWADASFWKAAGNTVMYAVVGIPAQLALGFAVALLLRRITRLRGLFRTIYFIPFVTPIVAAAWVWQWMYSPNFGPLAMLASAIRLPAPAFLRAPSQALYAIAALVVWEYLGFQVVIFLAGLDAIPRVYYEAAAVDGAQGWRMFRYITVPLLNPTLVFSVVYGTIVYLQLFTQVLNMTFGDPGGPLGSTDTIVLYVYILGFQRFHMGQAAAATVLLFGVLLLITLAQLTVLSRKVEY
ncbi:MAG TPA: sugar ABC transporter permease [bacterium]|nr:sugar ABC transporter permease [bacterium]